MEAQTCSKHSTDITNLNKVDKESFLIPQKYSASSLHQGVRLS